MIFQTLERSLTDRIDLTMVNFVDTVEDRIQIAILTAMDNFNIAFFGRNAASVTANSECGNIKESLPLLETSDRDNTFHELNANHGTQ